MDFELIASLEFETAFHVGIGLGGGGADRAIRSFESLWIDEDSGEEKRRLIPGISGDAFKGAVRLSAERIVRWLVGGGGNPALREQEDHSLPWHPALRRLFSSGNEGPPWYRFPAPRFGAGGERFFAARTAIDRGTGVAKTDTLRTFQHWSAGAVFLVGIEGRGGDWNDAGSADYYDLLLLAAAVQGIGPVGGKRGVGQGSARIRGLYWDGLDPHPQLDEANLMALQERLRHEARA